MSSSMSINNMIVYDDSLSNTSNITELEGSITQNLDYFKSNLQDIKKIVNFIENNNNTSNNTSNNKNKYNNCKYGTLCCKDNCRRNHPVGWSANDAKKRLSKITCKFGDKCNNKTKCLYFHKDREYCEKIVMSPINIPSSPINSIVKERSISISSNASETSRPEQEYYSLYVEYIANGFAHYERTPCWIILSDFNHNIVLDVKINPNLSRFINDIVSTLEPITGVNMDMLINEGISYNDAITKLKNILTKNSVIIGHNVDIDILKLGLEVGVHYKNYIDIVDEFKTPVKYSNNNIKNKYFSINQEAAILLSKEGIHDNNDKVITSMKIFKNWIKPGETRKASAKRRLLQYHTNYNDQNKNYVIDGVCCSPYRKDKCICN